MCTLQVCNLIGERCKGHLHNRHWAAQRMSSDVPVFALVRVSIPLRCLVVVDASVSPCWHCANVFGERHSPRPLFSDHALYQTSETTARQCMPLDQRCGHRPMRQSRMSNLAMCCFAEVSFHPGQAVAVLTARNVGRIRTRRCPRCGPSDVVDGMYIH